MISAKSYFRVTELVRVFLFLAGELSQKLDEMNSMNKIILVYGSIAGAVIIFSMSLGIYAAYSGADSFYASKTLGFSIMIIGFSMIFVATKKYRDQELGGIINFKTAFKLGLGISLMAGIMYTIGWEISLFLTDYVYLEPYKDTNYANPFFRMPITFTEIFPVGLLLSLISAGLFRNPNFLKSEDLTAQPE